MGKLKSFLKAMSPVKSIFLLAELDFLRMIKKQRRQSVDKQPLQEFFEWRGEALSTLRLLRQEKPTTKKDEK